MTQTKKINTLKNTRGMIFLTTIIFAFIMVLTAATAYWLTSQSLFTARYLEKYTQARYLAEAGLARAFAALKADATISNIPSTVLGAGAYAVSVINFGGRYLVSSTGTVQGTSRAATAEVTFPPVTINAFDYAISVGGTAQIDAGTGQSAGIIIGNPNGNGIYSQGSLGLDGPSSGGLLTIEGNAQSGAAATATPSVQIQNGALEPDNTNTIIFPAPVKTYYAAIAQANGTYYTGNQTFASGALPTNPAGGIIYVNGNVTMRGTQTLTGCLFVDGSLSISKSANNYPRITVSSPGGSDLPAIVCTGAMTFTSTGNGGAYLNTTGLVYTGGSFTYTSGNHDTLTMTGPLTVMGDLSVSPQSQNSTNITWAAANPPGFVVTNGGGGGQFTVVSYNT